MYTVTKRRRQSKTRYLIGVCTTGPNKWMEDMLPEYNRTQISLNEWEMSAKSGEQRLSFIIEFTEHRTNVKFNEITLTLSTKFLL